MKNKKFSQTKIMIKHSEFENKENTFFVLHFYIDRHKNIFYVTLNKLPPSYLVPPSNQNLSLEIKTEMFFFFLCVRFLFRRFANIKNIFSDTSIFRFFFILNYFKEFKNE